MSTAASHRKLCSMQDQVWRPSGVYQVAAVSLHCSHRNHSSDRQREWRELCVGGDKTPSVSEPACAIEGNG